MIFCVFSYNRGRFLKNCIESIEQCAPASKILIFDDNSNDEETIHTLGQLATKHKIIQPGHHSSHHLGGLYGNMQTALDHCADESIVCFLQDDTQMVRPVNVQEINRLEALFSENEDLGFLHPCFIRGINRHRGVTYSFDSRTRLYHRDPTQSSAGRHFSALLITKPNRLANTGWAFRSSEPANNRQAESLFRPMGYLFTPFAMWLPEVPSYRGKRKTLGLRLAERKRHSGYYPFRIMTTDEVAALEKREPTVLPYAEDFLHCVGTTPAKPWAYNPLTGTGWMKLLNQVEINLRRLLK